MPTTSTLQGHTARWRQQRRRRRQRGREPPFPPKPRPTSRYVHLTPEARGLGRSPCCVDYDGAASSGNRRWRSMSGTPTPTPAQSAPPEDLTPD